MNTKQKKSDALSDHILPVSATMIGVCITVITLFKVTGFHLKTYADEILGCDTLFFIMSCLLSSTSLRIKNSNKYEKIADYCFLFGLFVMVAIGFFNIAY